MNFKTIRDAAAALGVAESKLRRDVAAGTVPSMKLGTRAVVDIDAVADLLQKPEGVGIEAVSAETGLSVSAIRRAVREDALRQAGQGVFVPNGQGARRY